MNVQITETNKRILVNDNNQSILNIIEEFAPLINIYNDENNDLIRVYSFDRFDAIHICNKYFYISNLPF
jgi:hypothetical protein